jgi:nicotinamide riboside kinase
MTLSPKQSWSGDLRTRCLIAMLGGECTGKTRLAQALAQDSRVNYVPEVLRCFVDQYQRSPRWEEQIEILAAQCQGIERALCDIDPKASGPMLICDASPWMTAIYSLQYFGDRALFARAQALMLELADKHRCHWLHLHCADDIAWQADGLQRDGPGHRARSRALIEQYPPLTGAAGHERVVLLQGDFEQRFRVAKSKLISSATCTS